MHMVTAKHQNSVSGRLSFALVCLYYIWTSDVVMKSYQEFVVGTELSSSVCDTGLLCNKPHSLSIVQNVLLLSVKP